MKKIFLILFLILAVSAQNKYLVYFSDKGITEAQFNEQPGKFFKQAELELSDRAIERRKKALGNDYIKFIDLPVNQNYVEQIESLGYKVDNVLNWFNAVSIFADSYELEKLRNLDFIKKIERVKTFKVKNNPIEQAEKPSAQSTISYDLNYGNSLAQSEFHDIPIAHDAGYNAEGVIIGFLDSGFNWRENPALMDLSVLYEYDYVYNDDVTANQPEDVAGQDGHGTAVFSIAAGFEEGRLIGPGYGAHFFLAKTENITSETNVEEDNFAAAVEDFEEMGADVITASLGYSVFDSGEESYTYEDMNGETTLVAQAYNYAFDLGVVTVAAAGNEGNSSWRHIISPADAFDVLAVGNVTISGELNSSSSSGPTADGRIKPEVTAMGTGTYHSNSGGSFSNFGSGTSFAAPLVAGMVGQLLSAYPHLNNKQVRNIILHSGDNFENPNNDIGYGLLSIKRALEFPNIQSDAGQYKINKMFLNEEIINNQEFKIYFRKNNDDWNSNRLTYLESGRYPVELPADFNMGDRITFYYTFQDTSGQIRRVPEDKNFIVTLGEDETGFITDIVEFPNEVSNNFILRQNYPNPFNIETTIDFISPREQFGKVVIYNMLGQKVKELFSGRVINGKTRLTWNGTNENGDIVSTGTYFYSVTLGNQVQTKKMILLK